MVVVVVPTRRALLLVSPVDKTMVACAGAPLPLPRGLQQQQQQRAPNRLHLQFERDSPLHLQLRHFREQGADWT